MSSVAGEPSAELDRRRVADESRRAGGDAIAAGIKAGDDEPARRRPHRRADGAAATPVDDHVGVGDGAAIRIDDAAACRLAALGRSGKNEMNE